jgi:hypothetical protein
LRRRRDIADAAALASDYKPAFPLEPPCCGALVSLLGDNGAGFQHARFSFPSPGTRNFLCEPIDSWHVSKMPFSAREHVAAHWLDLAEGRLHLDRLNRNGVGETFFPWACYPARKSAGTPVRPFLAMAKKVSPPPSSAALRLERVRAVAATARDGG